MKVLAFGEILWDIIEGVEHLGGAPFNFAAHSAKIGNEVYIISRLGTDSRGQSAYKKCQEYGVQDSFIQWDKGHETGVVDVTLKDGQPDYVIKENVAWDFITDDGTPSVLASEKFAVFYFGSLVQRDAISALSLHSILARGNFKYIFYDVNLRKKGYNESIVKSSLKASNILKLNVDEVPVIAGLVLGRQLKGEEFCVALRDAFPNVTLIVITAAENGCYVYNGERLTHIPATPVQLVDAVGAGDAFSAAFMHIYANTGDAVQAAEIGNKVGAFVASQRGPIPEYSLEIKELLNRGIQAVESFDSP